MTSLRCRAAARARANCSLAWRLIILAALGIIGGGEGRQTRMLGCELDCNMTMPNHVTARRQKKFKASVTGNRLDCRLASQSSRRCGTYSPSIYSSALSS